MLRSFLEILASLMTLFFRTVAPLLSLALTAVTAIGGELGTSSFDAQSSSETNLKISYSIAALPIKRIEPEKDLWARIRKGFKLPESDPGLTRLHEQVFTRNSTHIERIAERSRPYLFHIVDQVEKRGMPMEIALLPMIESAFNPQAKSPKQASGIWQFMPATGRVFGLQQNAWYDGRRDILEATNAALDYLQKLHGMFGDWELALAAYNCGEGCVAKAQMRAAGNSYNAIRLPKETRNYVPKLVAVRNIILDPERFNINLAALPNEPFFLLLKLKNPMEARRAASLAEMDLDQFLLLNPAFQRRVIHTATQDVLLLPVDKIETFQFNLHQKGKQYRLQHYAAQRGESAQNIAKKFGVTLSWLKENNPVKLHNGKFAKAQTLVVPMLKTAQASSKPASGATVQAQAMRTHTVRKGETLAALAKRYNVKVAAIRLLNEDIDLLLPGRTLTIPVAS
jgi:membrane-bound lytic murein transglycosylase D